MTDRQRRLISLAIVAIVLTGTALSIYVAFSKADRSSRERAQSVLTDNAREQAATLSAALFGKLKILETISADITNEPHLREPEEIAKMLGSIKQDAELSFEEIIYADADGNAVNDSGTTLNVARSDYFRQAIAGSRAITAGSDSDKGRRTLTIAVPFYADDEEIAGAICGVYYENELQTLMHTEAYGGAGFSLLLDCNGEVIAKAERENILNGCGNIFDFFTSAGVSLQSGSSLEELRRALKDEHDVTIYYETDGSPRIAVIAPFKGQKLPDNNWHVMNVVELSQLQHETHMSRQDTFMTLFTFSIFAFAALVLFLLLERDHRNRVKKDSEQLYERDEDLRYAAQHDQLTGLFNRETFYAEAAKLIDAHEAGYYIMACFDINGFKMINDQYGTAKGDKLLRHLAAVFSEGFGEVGGICCRISADDFAVLYPAGFSMTREIENIRAKAGAFDGTTPPVTFSIGRYIVSNTGMTPDAMYDRAVIAKDSIKGRYDVHIGVFEESMRERILREQRIVNQMDAALANGEFEIWLQPQYNHATGMMIGAEALARWRHPELGMILPAAFVSVFERNGFIYELDKYVWEATCALLRRWLDEGKSPLPISVNVSRRDVFKADFFAAITGLVQKYRLPIELLRLEITESAFSESAGQIIATVRKLREYGFIVEIDDFGSGYSSLNTLKNVQADVLKLDMRFLEDDDGSHRGGNILESVVRMAKWLEMPVIAEGVETLEQADFLESIGCIYIQGYLYARPMPVWDYEALEEKSGAESVQSAINTVEGLDTVMFWNPKSLDSLIFSSYVGAACVLEFSERGCELIRVNDKYRQALRTTYSVRKLLETDPLQLMDAEGARLLREKVESAKNAGDEISGEFKLNLRRETVAHEEYLHYSARVIACTELRRIVYMLVENITDQREAEQREHQASMLLESIIESASNGVCAFDVTDGVSKLIFANGRYFEIHGYTREQFEAEVQNTFATVHPDDIERLSQKIASAYEKNERFATEYRGVSRSGAALWLHAAVTLMPYTGLEKPVLLAEMTDITARKLSEQRMAESTEQLRFLNETSKSFLTEANPVKAMDGVLSNVREYFGGSRVYVFERGPEKNCFSNTYEVCARGVTAEINNLQNVPESHMSFWLNTFKKESHIFIPNIDELGGDRQLEKETLQAQGIASLIAVPLLKNGSIVGFIGVDDPRRRLSGVEHLEALGAYIVTMLERRDSLMKIAADRSAMLELMNDTPGGFVRMVMNADGTIVPVFVNEGFCRIVGMSNAEVMEKYAKDAYWGVHPDDVETVRRIVFEMLKNGESYSARYRLVHGGGWYVTVRVFGKASRAESGECFFNVYYTNEEA